MEIFLWKIDERKKAYKCMNAAIPFGTLEKYAHSYTHTHSQTKSHWNVWMANTNTNTHAYTTHTHTQHHVFASYILLFFFIAVVVVVFSFMLVWYSYVRVTFWSLLRPLIPMSSFSSSSVLSIVWDSQFRNN